VSGIDSIASLALANDALRRLWRCNGCSAALPA